jgi:hypothetical protein
VFLSVTISHILKNENYELCFLAGSFVHQITTKKKGTVVWPSARMFGGSMSSDCFGGLFDQITTRKSYSCLAIGCNVWGVGSMCLDCFGGFAAMFFGGFLDQITNYDRKKGTVLWPSVGISTTYF